MSYRRMFSGEHGGDLCPLHISFRAGDVRYSIARLFADREFSHSREARAAAWRRAKREGWRVVSVKVEKIVTRADEARAQRRFNRLSRSLEPTAAECASNRAWDQVG